MAGTTAPDWAPERIDVTVASARRESDGYTFVQFTDGKMQWIPPIEHTFRAGDVITFYEWARAEDQPGLPMLPYLVRYALAMRVNECGPVLLLGEREYSEPRDYFIAGAVPAPDETVPEHATWETYRARAREE